MTQISKFLITLMMTVFSLAASANDGAQSAIDGQLRAFQSDNDAAAYDYAAPNVKMFFPTLERFMGMVKNGYKPIHRPESWSFGRVQTLPDGSIIQQMMLVDQTGRDWTAIYTVKQMDNDWKITGVSLKQSDTLTM